MATARAPPDADGWMSLSLHAGATVARAARGGADPDRVLVVEVNPSVPAHVRPAARAPPPLHVDEVDVLDRERPRPVRARRRRADRRSSGAIAEHAARSSPDGATLQTGIGGDPRRWWSRCSPTGDGGDYGIHSEMFTTGLMQLHQAGKVTNRTRACTTATRSRTFAAGTAELYDWLDGNEDVRFLPVDVVNSPEVDRPRTATWSRSTARSAIDLYGQVVADTIDGRQFSGIGGHEDFVAAAGARARGPVARLPAVDWRRSTAS